MSKMKVRVLIILFSVFTIFTSNAQCAMCRAVLESEDGQATAKGVNDGIVYLMVIPYVLVGGMGVVMYTKFSKKKKVE